MKEDIQKNEEKAKRKDWLPERLYWIRELKGYDKISFTSMMVLDAPVLILIVNYATGIILNIPLTYLIVDALLLRSWDRSEREKREREAEYAGDRTEIIRQKIEELKVIEREEQEREKREQEEELRKQLEKQQKKEQKQLEKQQKKELKKLQRQRKRKNREASY